MFQSSTFSSSEEDIVEESWEFRKGENVIRNRGEREFWLLQIFVSKKKKNKSDNMAMKSLVIIPAISNARNMKMSTTTIRPIAYTGDTTGGNGFYPHNVNTNVNILLGGYASVISMIYDLCYNLLTL